MMQGNCAKQSGHSEQPGSILFFIFRMCRKRGVYEYRFALQSAPTDTIAAHFQISMLVRLCYL